MLPDDDLDKIKKDLGLPTKKEKVVQPLHAAGSDTSNLAVNVIRSKIDALYASEPNAKKEISEAQAIVRHRSKHQQFMYELSTSGKPLAEIQTAWHNYYVSLPDNEKHQVWHEFYANYDRTAKPAPAPKTANPEPHPPTIHRAPHRKTFPKKIVDNRNVTELREQLLGKVSAHSTRKSHHHRSLLFGFGMGMVMLCFMLFGFFNERFIAPFITPSRNVSSTPIIVDAAAAVGPDPKIIIPKINVEIPVVYDEPSIEEQAVQRALERGVAHYATTPNPGELGNSVIFGHSSNNILNRGKYKFAFVLLNKLELGDTFMLDYKGKRYTYKVFDRKIVKPTEVSVLGPVGKPAAVTLITCDPPGTALNRLVVVAEQISPDPGANIAGAHSGAIEGTSPPILPANAPSLWSRLTQWLSN